MTVSSCPSCHENVTVPVEAQPESIVRCPLCQEQFRLKEFLAQLPPPLIVLSPLDAQPKEAADADTSATAAIFPQSAAAGSDHHIPAFDFIPDSAPREENVGVDSSYAAVRRQKNPSIEIAKVVAGGLLALPLAQLILWWLPGKWQRDPLQLGPSVGRVVPWVVPENFRPVELSAAPERQRQGNGKNNEKNNKSPGNKSGGTQAGGDASAQDASDPPRATKRGNGPPPTSGDQQATQAKSGRGGGNQSDSPAGGTASPSPADTTVNSAPSGRVVLGLKNAPRFSAEQLHEAMERALQASVEWDFSQDVTPEALASKTDRFYEAFAELGHVITFADPREAESSSYVLALRDLIASFGTEPKKLAMIGNRGAEWLRQSDRPNRGALLFGTVKQIRYRGQLYETTLELAARGDDRTVQVVSTLDPNPVFPVKSRVLILGSIVTDPAQSLVGYTGDASLVVMGGFPIPLPE